ncbi:PepSY-associated TM helix domain-containing protein [Methylomonas montana]|uniref:PepSY-associated TM helix domain-containing protein n=1 Tax=Methylomonas montana TaxID=3058963 RepID=UPI002657D973|nr:PepSY-associated TM helix domain-containing protein [Methylomonas montana]WKJ92378.1 PepSY-associated TM helix domain-containing protein [Methylomonas montana]
MNSIAAAVPATPKMQNLQRLKTRRKFWLKAHLWLGLSLGLFLAVIGLTGSVLVFWHEIDAVLNPTLYRNTTPSNTQKSLDEILDAAKHAAPPGWASTWTQIPEEANGNYVFGFYYPNISPPPEQAQSFMLGVNPYTAEVTHKRVFYHGSNPLKHSFVGFFFKLHYALLLGETGGTLVGILGVLFLISALSGLILWWPLTGKWRRVLTIKPRASIERFNHDLHQTAGFYSLIVLLAVLVSGIYFNLPDQFRWLVERVSPLTPEAEAQTPTATASITLAAALQQARLTYPGGVPRNYDFSGGDSGLFSACFDDVPELRRYVLASRCLVFNRADGKLLQIRDAVHGSGGDLFMQWQWPLHSGKAFGWTGRILVFISGLICPLLFVTGTIRWLQKRRAKKSVARCR